MFKTSWSLWGVSLQDDDSESAFFGTPCSCGGDQGVRSADTGGEVTSLWNWFWQIWLTKSTEYYSSNLKISNQLTSASSIVLFIRAQWELPLAIFSHMLIMKCTVSKTSRGTSSIKKSEQASICLEFALFSKNVPPPTSQHLTALSCYNI